jgi:hypothetical protein
MVRFQFRSHKTLYSVVLMAWGIVVVLILQLMYKAWESRYLFTNAHLEMLNSKYIMPLMVEQMSLSHQRLTNWNIAETQIFSCSNDFFHFMIGFFSLPAARHRARFSGTQRSSTTQVIDFCRTMRSSSLSVRTYGCMHACVLHIIIIIPQVLISCVTSSN